MLHRYLKGKVIEMAVLAMRARMRRRSFYPALFADAVRMQLGRLPPELFRERLDHFFATADQNQLLDNIELEDRKRQLQVPGGYKINIHYLRGDARPGTLKNRFSLWSRRFGLLRLLGIRSDIIILRAGEQIPPHGHARVISGFYVAEGQIRLRHYHRDRTEGETVCLRKAIDAVCASGGYGTNSDIYQSVHWLAGLAPDPVSLTLRGSSWVVS
jgi:hypothetical protein